MELSKATGTKKVMSEQHRFNSAFKQKTQVSTSQTMQYKNNCLTMAVSKKETK